MSWQALIPAQKHALLRHASYPHKLQDSYE